MNALLPLFRIVTYRYVKRECDRICAYVCICAHAGKDPFDTDPVSFNTVTQVESISNFGIELAGFGIIWCDEAVFHARVWFDTPV